MPTVLGGRDLEIDNEHIVQYAHYGYVYCMVLARGLSKNGSDEEMLITGGGDGTVKLWNLDQASGGISEEQELENGDNSVLSMAIDGTILYCGLLEGDINVWDLDTRQLVRNVKAHVQDVLTISVGGGFIFSAGASGSVRVRYISQATGRQILTWTRSSIINIDAWENGAPTRAWCLHQLSPYTRAGGSTLRAETITR